MNKQLFFLFLCIINFNSILAYTDNDDTSSDTSFEDFFRYTDNGKDGLLYNGEICIIPRFDEICTKTYYVDGGIGLDSATEKFDYYNGVGLFAYRNNDLWGVSTIHGFLTQAIYDKAKMYRRGFYAVEKDNKIQLFDYFGHEIFSGDNSIEIRGPFYVMIKKKKEKYGVAKDIYFFIYKYSDNKIVAKDIFNKFIIDIPQINQIQNIRPKDCDKIKNEMQKRWSDYINKIPKDSIKNRTNYIDSIFYISERINSLGYTKNSFLNRNMENLVLVKGDSIVDDFGFDGIINEFGYIDIPVRHNSPEDILKRDPYNLYALEKTYYDKIYHLFPLRDMPWISISNSQEWIEYYEYELQRDSNFKNLYKELAELALIIYPNKGVSSYFKDKVHNYEIRIQKSENEINRENKNIAFNQKVNQLVSIFTSFIDGISANETNNISNSNGISSSESSLNHPNNYQNQYDNWARRAESHFNSLTNLGYKTKNEDNSNTSGSSGKGRLSAGKYSSMKRSLREAQKQMRTIRNKASNAGVNIIKSEWEDATVSF